MNDALLLSSTNFIVSTINLTEQNPLELRRSINGGYLFIDQGEPGEASTVVNFRGADDPPDEAFMQEMVDRYNEHTLLKRTLQEYYTAHVDLQPENLEKLKSEFQGEHGLRQYETLVASLRVKLKRMERKVAALIVTLGV